MATTAYSTRFYKSTGAVVVQNSMSASNAGGVLSAEFNETVPTTQLDTIGDELWMMPAPTAGERRLLGFFLTAADMDSGTAALDADIIFRTVLNGVTTDTVVYDSSVQGLFSAALALKWVTGANLKLPQSDSGVGHFIFKVNVVAAAAVAGNLTFIPFIV